MHAGTSVRIFVDKSKTAFAFDDNEHQLQLKMGLNNWTEIHVYDLKKISEIPNVNDVYTGMVPLPRDLFAVDFVIQDFRTTKVCYWHSNCKAVHCTCSGPCNVNHFQLPWNNPTMLETDHVSMCGFYSAIQL